MRKVDSFGQTHKATSLLPCLGPRPLAQPEHIPRSVDEIKKLGWDYGTDLGSLDILLVSGDSLIDHPSFASALLARWLIAHGFRVAVLPQPRWEGPEALDDFLSLPRPRLFAGVSAGAIDSMLAHYTAFRKKRHNDAYTPGGQAGARPNRASIIYTGLLRRAFPGLPIVLGGLEASLRRVSHYDFWSDALRHSILLDSKADLLIYGMGEASLLQVAATAQKLAEQDTNDAVKKDKDAQRKALSQACRLIPGVVSIVARQELPALEQQIAAQNSRLILLPEHEAIPPNPFKLMQATQTLETVFHQGKDFLAQSDGQRAVLLPPPGQALDTAKLDALYGLPFARTPHPSYKDPIPAWEMIRTSITTHRGCGGGCSFCSLAMHQGRAITSRSRESVLAEAAHIAQPCPGRKTPRWAGAISDVGGPSANMWQGECTLDKSRCARASCLFPKPCPGFVVDQKKAVSLLREVASLPGVRHVRVASGVRFDMALEDQEALRAYSMEFTGGQLKIAPEHICDPVLKLMRKPNLKIFEAFLEAFAAYSRQAGLEQYVVPYIISAFPGCTNEHMRELAAWFKKRGWQLQQVQCFVPTPGTIATAMFYAECDPDGKPLYVAKTDAERLQQHHMLLDKKPQPARHGKPRQPMPKKKSTT